MNRNGRLQAVHLMVVCLLFAAVLRLLDLSSVPPGLHYDEAANGTLATGIGMLGDRPIFISSYTGKEVLFFYLAGALMRLLGDSVFTLRLTAAFVGLLSVAATYWLGSELFNDRRVSLVAAVLIGVSFWHLIFSRLGFRAITQPLLQTLAVAALFRGLRGKSKGWLLGGGVLLGLTAYTYLAARMFPLLLFLALIPLLFDKQTARLRWKQLTLSGAVAFAVLLPLIVYFASEPGTFWVRIRQVTPNFNEPGLTFGQRYLVSLKMFFMASDPHWRFNVPGRPLFDWFWGGLLVLGWIQLVLRWRHLKRDWQRAASLLIILAPFIMILPAALVTERIIANNMRIIGLASFIFILPAKGMVTLLPLLQRRYSKRSIAPAALAVGSAALAITGVITYRTYFKTWATQPSLYFESDGDLTAVATFLDEIDTDDATIYVSALHYRHPTLAFSTTRFNEIKWLTNSEALVFPAEGPAIYIFPRNSALPPWAMPFLKTAELLESIEGPDNLPAFEGYRMSEAPALDIPNPAYGNFDNLITLLGYEVENVASGAVMPVTLFWQVEDVPSYELTTFVHLQDTWGYRWSHAEPFAYPVAEWQPGETIIQRVDLPVPSGTPPGSYQLRVGQFRSESGGSLPQLDEVGRYAGDAYIIDDVTIAAGEPPEVLPQPPFLIEQQVRPGLHLIGYERGGDKVATGESYYLTLWWQAIADQPPLVTRLEVIGADERTYALTETQPVHGTSPFQAWQTPQFLIDHVSPRIPSDLPAGNYRLSLQVLDANQVKLIAVDLGPLAVESTERLFVLPDMTHQLAATFGNEIDLLAYELAPTAGPMRFSLSLAWHARARPTGDYTVFVHLLDRDGSCCVWQWDDMPRQNQYPTSRWLADEVVIDTYEIVLPEGAVSGAYPIEVGLYIAETGKRLQVVQPDESASDALILRPLQIGE